MDHGPWTRNMIHHKTKTYNKLPEARGQKLEASSKKLEASSKEPEARRSFLLFRETNITLQLRKKWNCF